MKKIFKFNLLLLSVCFLVFSGCKSGKPNMAYEQEDGGAIQEQSAFDVEATAENFKKSSKEFTEKTKKITEVQKNSPARRVSLTVKNGDKSTPLSIIDHNEFVKSLETDEVSLKLNDMDIKSAFKLFAGLVQRNILIGEEVDGNITIDFENIRWGSAVYALLDINNLIMIEDKDSGLLRVHSKEVYVQLEKDKINRTLEVNKNSITLGSGGTTLDDDGNAERFEVSEIFRVFNQTSENLIEPIQSLLSEDTPIQINNDEVNNQLLVKGTPEELDFVEKIVEKLDLEKKQVMIEAYLINATDDFNEQFKNNLQAFNASATANGEDGMTFFGIDGSGAAATGFARTTDESADVRANDYFTQDINLQNSAVIMGGIGFSRLKAIISMSIDKKNSETISNPKLFALDGQSSTLAQGNQLLKEIGGGTGQAATTVTIDQDLNMTVTPNITSDSQVELKLVIENSTPGTVPTGVTSTTATNSESLNSTVRVRSGQVAVLGGVYKNSKNDNTTRTPFFSKIPILGTFFRSETREDNKTQLLIFISANIV